MIPERIIFVSRGITVIVLVSLLHADRLAPHQQDLELTSGQGREPLVARWPPSPHTPFFLEISSSPLCSSYYLTFRYDIWQFPSLATTYISIMNCYYTLESSGDTIQYRQCTYDVIMRRVCATIVAVGKQWVLHNLCVCVCSLKYPACNAHAPYCHLWPDPVFYNIFFHIFSLTLRWLISYIYGAPILDVSRSHTTTQHSR